MLLCKLAPGHGRKRKGDQVHRLPKKLRLPSAWNLFCAEVFCEDGEEIS